MKIRLAIIQLFSCFLLVILANPIHSQPAQTAKPDSTDKIQKVWMDRIMVVGMPVWMTQIPGAASYISSEQIQEQNYSDINRVLRSVSGVNIQEEDGFGLRPNIGLRGAGVERSTKINIMEDGILAAPAPYSAPAAYYFPNISRINSVEVRKGSSQIKYGPNTTGGAINLISTPIPSEFSGRTEFGLGERNANKFQASIGNSTSHFGYMIEGLHLTNDGFKVLDNDGNTGFKINDILGKIMFRTGQNASVYQRLEIKVGYNDQVSDETYLGLTREDYNTTPLRRYAGSQADRMTTEHFQFMARHLAFFNDGFDVTTTLYRNNFSRDWYKLQSVAGQSISNVLSNPSAQQTALNYLRGGDSPDNALAVRSNNREYYAQGIETIVGLNFDLNQSQHSVQIGARLHQDEEDRFQYEDQYAMRNGTMVLTTPGIPGTQANRVGSATALSFYIQDEISIDKFTITPGIRFENIWFNDMNYGGNDLNRTGSNLRENEYTISEFVPGIGFTYRLNNQFTFISGIHKGFSPPSPGSSGDTRSEQSVNYEIGFRFADSRIQTEVIGFFNDYSNLLGSDLAAGGGSGTTAQFNAGEVRVLGLEFSSSMDFSDFLNLSEITLPLRVNYTYTNATFQSNFQSNFGPWGTVSIGDEIPFIPTHQFNSSFGLGFSDYSFHLNMMYSPEMRTLAGSGTIDPNFATDSHFIADVSAQYQFFTNVNLFMNIRNLFDQRYVVSDRPAGLRPGLPRTVMAGLRVTF